MKISYNWLQDYIKSKLTVEEAADILTRTGLEVEDIETYQSIKGGLNGLIVGEILSVEKHPDADRLKITSVNIGNGKPLQIVCGAPNVAAGQKVIVAPVGTTIYPSKGEAFKIKNAKIRGIASEGMICADDEIGLGENHDGITVLDKKEKQGTYLKDVYNVSQDQILEIGLTPNRSDAMSHLGVARDLNVALTYQKAKGFKFEKPSVDHFKKDNNNLQIDIEVRNKEACPRYAGLSMTNIKIAPSPDWLQNKLKAIGINPTNNVVDITNFVLHETGQPLHAFDADKISGKEVVVDTLKDNTSFVTLDEKERKLSKEDLMICNAKTGMCIAGVFGGIDSGVSDKTVNIFLESAYFNPNYIRKTANRHGLRTDAAIRFEKGTDPDNVIYALKRAALLIKDICGADISSDIIDVYPKAIPNKKVSLSLSYVNDLIGVDIPIDDIKSILTAQDIKILKENKETIELEIPKFKADVTRPADIVEEIVRIYGYDNIPYPKHLKSNLSHITQPDKNLFLNKIANHLTANGFNEMYANSVTTSKYATKQTVPLLNFNSADLDVLRSDMIYSGLEALQYNLNRKNNHLKFYELGKTYAKTDQGFSEREQLTIFISGKQTDLNWTSDFKGNLNFFHAKGVLHSLLSTIGIKNIAYSESNNEHLNYGMDIIVNKINLGYIGLINQNLLQKFDVKQDTFYINLDIKSLLEIYAKQKIQFKAIPKFPSVSRDLSLVIDRTVQFGEIESICKKTGTQLLKHVNLTDIYIDDKLGENKKAYTVNFNFLDEHKTLTDEVVDKIMSDLMLAFEKNIKALIRK